MKLTHLRDVIAVAEHGSIRSAGRHLGVAQPAITRSIREVENELGVSLFERHAKGVRLTNMGEAFLRRAGAVQAELQRAHEEISQMKGRMTGEVSVALSTATCMALMPRAIAIFRQRYPDAVLKISESLLPPIESELADGTIDLYAGPVDPAFSSSQLVMEHLFDNHRMVIGRVGHPLTGAKCLADLEDARWVRPTLSTRHTEGDFDEMFKALGLPRPKIVLHAHSALITLIAVANSDLLTILPQQWLDFAPTSGLLAAIKLADPIFAAPINIVRRREMPLTPMAEHLCDTLRRVAANYAHSNQIEEAHRNAQSP